MTSADEQRLRLKRLLDAKVETESHSPETTRQSVSGGSVHAVLVPIRETGRRAPLICVHGGGAGVPSYRRLAEQLSPDQPVLAIQMTGLSADASIVQSIEQMAAVQLRCILNAYPAGPCCLCGHSMGATIAWEMTQQLARSGRIVSLLILFDQPGPDICLTWWNWVYWQWMSVLQLPWRQRLAYVRDGVRYRVLSSRWLPRWFKAWAALPKPQRGTAPNANRKSVSEFRLRMLDSSIEALQDYRPQSLDVPVVLIRAKSSAPRIHGDRWGGWGEVTHHTIDVIDIAGHHMNLFEQANVRALAEVLEPRLRAATPPSTSDSPSRAD